eukprot:10512754-Alexandrium_andersonii.AAC.1
MARPAGAAGGSTGCYRWAGSPFSEMPYTKMPYTNALGKWCLTLRCETRSPLARCPIPPLE